MNAGLGISFSIADQSLIHTFTINAAWQYHEEARKGTLEEGKLADLVILKENPLSCPVEEIGAIAVLETIKEGVTVYIAK